MPICTCGSRLGPGPGVPSQMQPLLKITQASHSLNSDWSCPLPNPPEEEEPVSEIALPDTGAHLKQSPAKCEQVPAAGTRGCLWHTLPPPTSACMGPVPAAVGIQTREAPHPSQVRTAIRGEWEQDTAQPW